MGEWRKLRIVQPVTESGIGGAVDARKVSGSFQRSAECNRRCCRTSLCYRSCCLDIDIYRILELFSRKLAEEALSVCLTRVCRSACRTDKIIRADCNTVCFGTPIVFFPSGICVEASIRPTGLDNGKLNTCRLHFRPIDMPLPAADINTFEFTHDLLLLQNKKGPPSSNARRASNVPFTEGTAEIRGSPPLTDWSL